jgi:Zn-dependent protease
VPDLQTIGVSESLSILTFSRYPLDLPDQEQRGASIDMQADAQAGLTPQPTGNDGLPDEEQTVTGTPADEFEESVLTELEKIRTPKGNWLLTLLILAVSLALFLGLGMRDNPIAFTAMLVGVLFFHEMGHYVGMRIFGYRNVRMFFIPFFGAAVSGQRISAKSHQEAIVTLLGPLPGLCLAAVLFGVAFVPGIERNYRVSLVWAAFMFGLINGFNLLPIFPLDGGRLLNQILFSRNRYLESLFLVLAALALMSYGVFQYNKIFLFLGLWLLVSVLPTFKMNAIVQCIIGQYDGQMPPLNEPIPMPIFRLIVGQVKSRFPNAKTAKGVAGLAFRVWEKMHVQPPGAVATILLLLGYLLGLLLSILWLIPFFIHSAKH